MFGDRAADLERNAGGVGAQGEENAMAGLVKKQLPLRTREEKKKTSGSRWSGECFEM